MPIKKIGLKYAFNGISIAFGQINFKIQFLIFLLVILLGALMGISRLEWLIILFVSVLVLGIEMVNTAIEKMCDIIDPSYNESIKDIKDISAGAVLVVAAGALMAGGIIFIPKLIRGLM